MSIRRLARSDLTRLDPGVFTHASVVAIVPVTGDVDWAVDCAWELARVAAARGRRVALIDLSLERPALDRGGSVNVQEGIVDAFLYGVSLGRVAQPQKPKGLHFIGVGTRAADPTEIWASERWTRLTQGFAKEGALLLAFLPVTGVPTIALDPHSVVLLARDGFDTYEHHFPDLDSWLDGSLPIWVVEEEHQPDALQPTQSAAGPAEHHEPLTPPAPSEPEPPLRAAAQEPATAPTPPRDSPIARPGRRTAPRPPHRKPERRQTPRGNRRFLLGAILVFVVVVGAMFGWPELRPRLEALASADPPPPDSVVTAPPLGASVIDTVPAEGEGSVVPEPASAVEPETPPPLDSLFYGVQVAAFNSYDRAMTHALEVGQEQLAPTVTPVRIGGERVWYRVIVGTFATSAQADSALRAFWARGAVERGQGTVIRTPQAFDLGMRSSLDSAMAEVLGLRRRGLPAYVVRAPDGARVFVGAFQRPAQAAAAESLLTNAGITAPLVPRMGIRQ